MADLGDSLGDGVAAMAWSCKPQSECCCPGWTTVPHVVCNTSTLTSKAKSNDDLEDWTLSSDSISFTASRSVLLERDPLQEPEVGVEQGDGVEAGQQNIRGSRYGDGDVKSLILTLSRSSNGSGAKLES